MLERKVLLCCVAASLFGIVSAGCEARWHTIASEDGRLTAAMPGRPDTRSYEFDEQSVRWKGKEWTVEKGGPTWMNLKPTPRTFYWVRYEDIPTGWQPEQVVEKHIAARRETAPSDARLERRSVKVGRFDAVEVTLDAGEARLISRICIVGTRVYSAEVMEPRHDGSSEEVIAFLDSFLVMDPTPVSGTKER